MERGVSYDDRFDKDTVMNVVLPGDGAQRRPGVLLIHGGGWRSGGRWHFRDLSRRLARSGYVVANIEYRLAPKHHYPLAVQDTLCALAFFRAASERFGLDPDRVAVMGYSAGGHLASLIGVAADHPALQPDCVAGGTGAPQAVVSGAGIHDFDTAFARNSFIVGNFLGGNQREIPEVWTEASPVTHVGANAPPFLFVVGTVDPLIRQQRTMHQALLDSGNDTRLLVLPGSGHLFGPGAGPADRAFEMSLETPEAVLATLQFLEETLGAP